MDNPAVPIPSISPQPEASPTESPNRRWFLWLIGGIALLALGAAIGVFGAKIFSQPQSQLVSTPTPTPSPAPTPATDTTADWEIYLSKEYGYKITYPKENIEFFSTGRDFHIAILGKVTKSSVFPFKAHLAIEVLQNPKKLSLEKLGNEKFATDSPTPYDLGWSNTVFNQISAITAIHYPPGDAGKQTIYIFENKGDVFAAWKAVGAVEDENYYGSLVDQILSTFRFTEQNNEICNINQEYQNTTVNPVTCECPQGYEWEIISTSFGPCRVDQVRDCPQTLQKCSPKN